MKALVTGGTGVVGRAAVTELLKRRNAPNGGPTSAQPIVVLPRLKKAR